MEITIHKESNLLIIFIVNQGLGSLWDQSNIFGIIIILLIIQLRILIIYHNFLVNI
jgi:hypothetical protein